MKHSYSDLSFLAIIRSFWRHCKYEILFIFIIYLLGAFGIILANFDYNDDLGRSLFGYYDTNFWSRYVGGFVMGILRLNADFLISIFPYSLFISIFILSLSSLLLVYVVDKSLVKSKLALIASIAVGLSPYYLSNLTYKFDAPFMALSVFVSIVPFVFLRLKAWFVIVSIVSLLIMLTSYQASSGIYIIIAMFLAFKNLLNGVGCNKTLKSIILPCIISYAVALCLFYVLAYTPTISYADNTTWMWYQVKNGALIFGVKRYLLQIYNDINGSIFPFLVAGLSIIFVAKSIIDSKINRLYAAILSIFTLLLMLVFTFGLYLALSNPLLYPRAFIGFGVFVAILAIYALDFRSLATKISSIMLTLALAQYLLMFANYYGQALKGFDDYRRFRIEILAKDLADIINENEMNLTYNAYNIAFKNKLESIPYTHKSLKYYPLIDRLINSDDVIWTYTLLNYYGIHIYDPSPMDFSKGEIVLDNYYHKITRLKDNQEVYYEVEFKANSFNMILPYFIL